MDINNMDPMTGRVLKEDGTFINFGDLLAGVAITRKSASPPLNPQSGDLWVDTAGPTLKIYSGGSWVAV